MSTKKWDVESFILVLENIRHKLQESKFENQMEAIQFFENEIKNPIIYFINELQERGELF